MFCNGVLAPASLEPLLLVVFHAEASRPQPQKIEVGSLSISAISSSM